METFYASAPKHLSHHFSVALSTNHKQILADHWQKVTEVSFLLARQLLHSNSLTDKDALMTIWYIGISQAKLPTGVLPVMECGMFL